MQLLVVQEKGENGKSRRGFTLIEVVVGMLIITVIGISFLVVFTSAYTSFFILGRQTRAVNEAQSLIETYYSNPSTIDDSEWKFVADLSGDLLGDISNAGYNKFYSITTKSKTDIGTINDVNIITVVVYYDNNSKSVNLSALAP